VKVAETLSVKFYCGSKEDERPLSILVEGKEEMVVDVFDQAVEEETQTGKRRRRFLVRTEGGRSYAVKEEGGAWVVSRLVGPDRVG